jgi:hypothetical protein
MELELLLIVEQTRNVDGIEEHRHSIHDGWHPITKSHRRGVN